MCEFRPGSSQNQSLPGDIEGFSAGLFGEFFLAGNYLFIDIGAELPEEIVDLIKVQLGVKAGTVGALEKYPGDGDGLHINHTLG